MRTSSGHRLVTVACVVCGCQFATRTRGTTTAKTCRPACKRKWLRETGKLGSQRHGPHEVDTWAEEWQRRKVAHLVSGLSRDAAEERASAEMMRRITA